MLSKLAKLLYVEGPSTVNEFDRWVYYQTSRVPFTNKLLSKILESLTTRLPKTSSSPYTYKLLLNVTLPVTNNGAAIVTSVGVGNILLLPPYGSGTWSLIFITVPFELWKIRSLALERPGRDYW